MINIRTGLGYITINGQDFDKGEHIEIANWNDYSEVQITNRITGNVLLGRTSYNQISGTDDGTAFANAAALKAYIHANFFFESPASVAIQNPLALVNRFVNSLPPQGMLFNVDGGINEHGWTTLADGRLLFVFRDSSSLYCDILRRPYDFETEPASIEGGLIDDGTSGSQTMQYPKACYWPASGHIHIFANGATDGATWEKSAATWEGLLTATWSKVDDTLSDFCAVVRPDGSLIGMGQYTDCFIYTRTTPAAPWVKVKSLYPQVNGLFQKPGYATGQADLSPFYDNGDLYVLYNGISYAHAGTQVRRWLCIQKIDPGTLNPIGRAVNFLHAEDVPVLNDNSGSGLSFNPAYVKNDLTEGYSIALIGSGMTFSPLSKDESGPLVRPTDVFNFVAGSNVEQSSNVALRSYGTITNDNNGLRMAAEDSGLWGYTCNEGYLADFGITLRLKCNWAVGAFSYIFKVFADDYSNRIALTMDQTGIMYFEVIANDGTTRYLKAGTIPQGYETEITLTHIADKYYVNGYPAFDVVSNAILPELPGSGLKQARIVSLINDGYDAVAPGHQFRGAILSLRIYEIS